MKNNKNICINQNITYISMDYHNSKENRYMRQDQYVHKTVVKINDSRIDMIALRTTLYSRTMLFHS